MIVHLDGDVLVYRAGFAAEHTFWKIEWDLDGTTLEREFETRKALNEFMQQGGLTSPPCVISSRRECEPEENALFNARSMIATVKERMQADEVIVYLSGPTNFRLGLAKIQPYKGNRDPDHKPVHAPAIKAMLRREYNVVTSDGQEADDDIATAHYSLWLRDPYSTVIATIDKDLDMVPGLHYNFAKDEQYNIEPDVGIRKFYEQLLKGDTTDNIRGIPGIGSAKATKALADCNDELAMYAKCRELYAVHYPDDPDGALLETGRLLWMRLRPDEFWNPPGA